MSQLKLTSFVNAPLDVVFEKHTNFKQAEELVDAIVKVEMLTDGPVGKGTRFKETRVMFGREATEEMEITAFETQKLFTVSADSCGSHFDSTFRFTRQDGGTLVEMEMVTKANSIIAKLMWPVGKLMTLSMKKMMQADMDQVKAACEKSIDR